MQNVQRQSSSGELKQGSAATEDSKSTLISRNITVKGRRTSVRLEPEMWGALQDIAQREKCHIHDICTLICLCKKTNTSLTAAIRVFVMLYYKAAATEQGHQFAGHGDFKNMLDRARLVAENKGNFFSRKIRKSTENNEKL